MSDHLSHISPFTPGSMPTLDDLLHNLIPFDTGDPSKSVSQSGENEDHLVQPMRLRGGRSRDKDTENRTGEEAWMRRRRRDASSVEHVEIAGQLVYHVEF